MRHEPSQKARGSLSPGGRTKQQGTHALFSWVDRNPWAGDHRVRSSAENMKPDSIKDADTEVAPQSHFPRRARRISLSSGPGANPAPPPRSQQFYVSFRRSLAGIVLALLWELWEAVTGRRGNGSRSPLYKSPWFLGPMCCLMLSEMGKAAIEEKLAQRVQRKLREKLEDSFKGGQSVVHGVWVRAGLATEVGFALAVDPPPSAGSASAKVTSDAAAAAASAGEVDATTTSNAGAGDGVPGDTAGEHLLAVSEGTCGAAC